MKAPKPVGKMPSRVEGRRRSKLLEPPKEPPRPKAHWDHVLEEMAWLAKDFESERKWKLSHAKKIALRVTRSVIDQPSRGEIRMKEEEQRIRRLAGNIAKEVKKFWMKIEKLVVYKHQRDLEERRKKARDKQLDFLLGQTERYSTMLAENLADLPSSAPKTNLLQSSRLAIENCQNEKTTELEACKELASPALETSSQDCLESKAHPIAPHIELGREAETEDEFSAGSVDNMDDDEATLEADEALITEDERMAELAALKGESDLPLEEILKRYSHGDLEDVVDHSEGTSYQSTKEEMAHTSSDLELLIAEPDKEADTGQIKPLDLQETKQKVLCEEAIRNGDTNIKDSLHIGKNNCNQDDSNHSRLLQSDARIEESVHTENSFEGNGKSFQEIFEDDEDDNAAFSNSESTQDDGEYTSATLAEEDEDDEATLVEEEELAKAEGNDTTAEIDALKAECELPIEVLLERYKQIEGSNTEQSDKEEEVEACFKASEARTDVVNDTKKNKKTISSVPEERDCSGVVEQIPHENDRLSEIEEEKNSEVKIADAAAAARLAQPTGNTFSTTKVRTKLPFLLKHPLREYQHIGLDWLVTMYEKRLNGILADEMGLGKTIMTIALLAHLACEKGIWGPHLIVVPTSVMLNWETEFMKWCPAFKVLTYFGSAKERKIKRIGWAKPNSFHVCITTYRLVIQDAKAFKRKKWKYLILDEAHLIKNWKSQRWQTLLNFNSKRRILLTGTPLQNDLMELWSLMHFLMPHLFQSQHEFKDWFSNPIAGMVERQENVNKEVVDRLHNVLRPFILRRLKQDVEKQLPKKYEHVISCKLSKRQRNLYEDFIASSETQATLASGNFLGLINVLMQLRKVCNHPDLFEGRPIVSSFDMPGLEKQVNSSICSIIHNNQYRGVDLVGMNLVFTHLELEMNSWEYDTISEIATPSASILEVPSVHRQEPLHRRNIFEEIQQQLHEDRVKQARGRAILLALLNSLRCRRKPVYGINLRNSVTVEHPVYCIHKQNENPARYLETSSLLANLVLSPSQRCHRILDLIESFVFAIPAARAPSPTFWCSKSDFPAVLLPPSLHQNTAKELSVLLEPLRPVIVRRQLFFPDKRLIQFDCGKLQELATLLRRLKSEGHRALIFTQMTKMLDVLEAFINLYGYTYVRLDGSTQPEERQILMQRFNTNPKIFLFILSTRSGGVGINLVGADTVIFYDSDWNPAMDQQAQDRCHRIGQTREVHIYRLVSEKTIEENIIKKANQKRVLDDLVIQSGGYNTEFFKKLDPMELFSGLQGVRSRKAPSEGSDLLNVEDHQILSNADLEAALKNAEDEADYMALKKVELEDAAHDQEFTEDVVGRLLEDDDVNELEEAKAEAEAKRNQDDYEQAENKVDEVQATEIDCEENQNMSVMPVDSGFDMMVDVQHIESAEGNVALSLQDRLLPVERYAMQFLEKWDPIIDKAALESQIRFEEAEWELDRLEKLKEEQEAEIDEDNEPLLYESWDTEYANETYRQQVQVLAQQQLLQDQPGSDTDEAVGLDDDGDHRASKHRLKTKQKKKFRSLKRGELASNEDEFSLENNYSGSGDLHGSILAQRKRKKLKVFEDEVLQGSHLKKLKRNHANDNLDIERQPRDLEIDGFGHVNQQDITVGKGNGKIIITGVPAKRFSIIKLDNKKKKVMKKAKDQLPLPDKWSTSEDAILCAIMHEYGINWDLASCTLYGITGGGFYRGRYRHPAHCRERFGELFLNIISSTAAVSNSEKVNSSVKTLLKVTEDHVKKLLDHVQELPDNDFLLQRHFAAVLNSVSRFKGMGQTKGHDRCVPTSPPISSASPGLPMQDQQLSCQPVHVDDQSSQPSAKECGVRNSFGGSGGIDLVRGALHDANKDTEDQLCKDVMALDQKDFSHLSSEDAQDPMPTTEHLVLELNFQHFPTSVCHENLPQTVTVAIYEADSQLEPLEMSENIVQELADGSINKFIRDLEDSPLVAKPSNAGKHACPTEPDGPSPKKLRLLDLNQGISEAKGGKLDSTNESIDMDVSKAIASADRMQLLLELRNIRGDVSEIMPSKDVISDDRHRLDAMHGFTSLRSKVGIISDLSDDILRYF